MARHSPRNLQQLIDGKRLQQFADFTEQHRIWQQHLLSCLTQLGLAPLQKHCRVLNIRANTLIIQVSAATIATRLKLQQERIITYFQCDATLAINRLEIRIAPAAESVPQNRAAGDANDAMTGTDTAPATTEPSTAEKLRQQAQYVDEPLRSQLLALADKYANE